MPKIVRRTLTILVLSSLGIPAANAQSDASERDYFQEFPVVLSVSRLAQPLDEAPGAVTVIDRDMIRQSGARQLVDLLRLVPGFQVLSLPSNSGPPIAVYHGLVESYPRGLQVLLDGRSQYSPFFVGGVNWNLIPIGLDDIDHIEVVRGSNSAAYGSNAVLGVVNIVTRHTQDTQGASAELRSGTHGVNDKSIRLGTGGQDFSLRYSGESRFDTGFDAYRDDVQSRIGTVRADWRPDSRNEFQLHIGEISTTQQVGRGVSTDPYRDQKQSQQYLQLGWKRALSENEDISVKFYRSTEKATDAFAFSLYSVYAVPVPFQVLMPNYTVPVDYGFQSIRNNLEATHTISPSASTRLVWGGELRTDEVRNFQYYGRTDYVSLAVARLFGNFEWRFAPGWVGNAGATWEHDTNSKTTFAPRLAVNWHLTPSQTLRAGISQAFRAPSLLETRGDWSYGSTTGVALDRKLLVRRPLAPESVISREVGWMGEFKPLKLSGDIRIFNEHVANRISTIPTDLAPAPCERISQVFGGGYCGSADGTYNAADVRIRGIEYQWRWQPLQETKVTFNQAFVRIGADFHVPTAAVTAGYKSTTDIDRAVYSAPTHSSMLMVAQQLPAGLELSASYYSVGATNPPDSGSYVKHWQRLDWRLGYRFRVGPTRGELAFTVQNDGNPHAEHAPTEVVSRRGFVSLRLDY